MLKANKDAKEAITAIRDFTAPFYKNKRPHRLMRPCGTTFIILVGPTPRHRLHNQ